MEVAPLLSVREIREKDWITTRELAVLLDKTPSAARRWAWRYGINRSPSDYALLNRASVDIALRRGTHQGG